MVPIMTAVRPSSPGTPTSVPEMSTDVPSGRRSVRSLR